MIFIFNLWHWLKAVEEFVAWLGSNLMETIVGLMVRWLLGYYKTLKAILGLVWIRAYIIEFQT
jgi:hypothetical protein